MTLAVIALCRFDTGGRNACPLLSFISSHVRDADIGFIMVGIWLVALCAVVIHVACVRVCVCVCV
jgi:hypothetical protein